MSKQNNTRELQRQSEQLNDYNDFVVRKLAEGWNIADFDKDAIKEFLNL